MQLITFSILAITFMNMLMENVYLSSFVVNSAGYGASIGRIPLPNKQLVTLSDYRTRIAQYRTDPDLVANHQHYPWIPTWDDVCFS